MKERILEKTKPTKNKFQTILKLQILLNCFSILNISYLIATDAINAESAVMGFLLAISIKLASDNVDDLWRS
jgi:hypothetical protein